MSGERERIARKLLRVNTAYFALGSAITGGLLEPDEIQRLKKAKRIVGRLRGELVTAHDKLCTPASV